MAFWDKITSRGNVEDRRGLVPVVGGISLGGLALILLVNTLTGGDFGDVINQLENIQTETPQSHNIPDFEGEDSYEVFAEKVLGSNNEMWEQKLSNYDSPLLVLFRTSTESACGVATSEVGPHYCPLDKTIYLDETFFDELVNRFGAQGGDVAEAYVISHEVAHHVQNQLGIMERFRQTGRHSAGSITLELQADCFAGIWANSIKELSVFEPGEINEAMDAAAAVGDDRIQESVTGMVNPETWTHGSSKDRVGWFSRGFETGNLNDCNPF